MHDLTGPLDFFYNINKYQQTSASLLSTIRIFFTLSRQKFRIMAGPGPNLRIVGSWIMQDFLMTRFVVWCFVVPSGLRNTAGPTIRLHCMGFMWYLWYLLMPSFWSCFSRYRDVILSVTCEMGRSKHNFVWSTCRCVRGVLVGMVHMERLGWELGEWQARYAALELWKNSETWAESEWAHILFKRKDSWLIPMGVGFKWWTPPTKRHGFFPLTWNTLKH